MQNTAFLQEVGQSLTAVRLKNEWKCSAFMRTRFTKIQFCFKWSNFAKFQKRRRWQQDNGVTYRSIKHRANML